MAKRLTAEEVEQLWITYKAEPTIEGRNRLVEHYMPLVKACGERVRSRFPNEVDVDDLISVGYLGLMGAIESFDLSRGNKFETYAPARVQGAMLDEIRHLDWVPRLVRARASKLNGAVQRLELQLGRTPTDEELAKSLDITPDELEKLRDEVAPVGVVSLHRNWNGDSNEREPQENDLIEDCRNEDPLKALQRKDLLKLITKGLSKNERMIVLLYYYEEMTMREIGATLNLSESRVSQMRTQIVQRLQQQLAPRQNEWVM